MPSIEMKPTRRKGPKLDIHGLNVTWSWSANAVGLQITRGPAYYATALPVVAISCCIAITLFWDLRVMWLICFALITGRKESSMCALVNLGVDGLMVAKLCDVLHVQLRLPIGHEILPRLKALRDWVVSGFRDSSPERNGSNYDISAILEKPPRIDTVQVRTWHLDAGEGDFQADSCQVKRSLLAKRKSTV